VGDLITLLLNHPEFMEFFFTSLVDSVDLIYIMVLATCRVSTDNKLFTNSTNST